MSTATNLGEPAEQQGAGQVNAARAVQLARSIKGSSAKRSGHNLLVSPNKLEALGAPGSSHSAKITVQNNGTSAHAVHPVVKHFAATKSILNKTVTLDSTASNTNTFTYWLDGQPEPYVEQDVTVPAGYQRLDASFGFPQTGAHAGQEVFIVLFDPKGKQAQDSDPQGPSGFGQDDVRNPMPGKWRVILFSRPGGNKYSGPIALSATVQKNVTVPGSVSPASASVPAGGSKTFTVKYKTPANPGDGSATVNFGAGVGAVPILTRSTVPVTAAKAGTFSGVLTTGNGRQTLTQEQEYQFNVPAGLKDIDVDVHVADPGYDVFGTLIPPNHNPVDTQSSDFVDETQETPTDVNQQTVHLSWQSPRKGLWEIDLVTIGGSGSGKVSSPFTGTISFNTVHVTSSGLPASASTVLTPGTTTTAHVKVTNTGNSPEIYYLDPRLNETRTYPLGFINDPSGTTPGGNTPQALVPPESSSMTMVANAGKKVVFSTSPSFGTPEILSTTGTTAVASFAGAPEASTWSCGPVLVGPFSGPASSTTFSCAAFAATHAINDDIDATGGNLWDTATDPNSPNVISPGDSVVVAPGDTATLRVRITPSADEAGEVLSGHLAVQTFNPVTDSSDDLKHIPYSYKVGNAP